MHCIIFYAILTVLATSPAIQGVVTINKVVVRIPNPNDMGLIFDLSVANTAGAHKEPLEYLIRADGNCGVNITEHEIMQNAGRIVGGNFGLIQPGTVDTISLIWPTISLYNRVGVCPIVLTSRNADDAQIHIRQILHFDTRFSTLDPEGRTFRKQRDYKDCQNWDKDYLSNCKPVDCIERYFGQRSFYNKTSERCEKVPHCGKLFEMYNKFTNECVKSRRFCSNEDIKSIRLGKYFEDETCLSPKLPLQAKASTPGTSHNKNKSQKTGNQHIKPVAAPWAGNKAQKIGNKRIKPAGAHRTGKPQAGKTKGQSKLMHTVPAPGGDPENARGPPADKSRGPTPDHSKGPTHENAKVHSSGNTEYGGAQNRRLKPAHTHKPFSGNAHSGISSVGNKKIDTHPVTGASGDPSHIQNKHSQHHAVHSESAHHAPVAEVTAENKKTDTHPVAGAGGDPSHIKNKHNQHHAAHSENAHQLVVADFTVGVKKVKSPQTAPQPNNAPGTAVPPRKAPSPIDEDTVALTDEGACADEESEASIENVERAAETDEEESHSWLPYWLKGLADGLLIVLATIAIYLLICFMIFLIVTWLSRRHCESGNKADYVVCTPPSVPSSDDFLTRTSSSLLTYGH